MINDCFLSTFKLVALWSFITVEPVIRVSKLTPLPANIVLSDVPVSKFEFLVFIPRFPLPRVEEE